MTKPASIDELEMELRILGRQLNGERPSAELIQRTTAASVAHLATCTLAARRRQQLIIGTVIIVAATLPVPALFLWGDWAAASALFDKLLSPKASEIASTVYLWIRVCALTLMYALVLPGVAWWALRMNNLASENEVRYA